LRFEVANGGGWGDPLDRDPRTVRTDVKLGRLSAEQACETYGVIIDDGTATDRRRRDMLAERLQRAHPAAKPLTWTAELRGRATGEPQPLYHGVLQRGSIAVSARTGEPLAQSPDHWTEGCPVVHRFLPSDPEIDIVAYP